MTHDEPCSMAPDDKHDPHIRDLFCTLPKPTMVTSLAWFQKPGRVRIYKISIRILTRMNSMAILFANNICALEGKASASRFGDKAFGVLGVTLYPIGSQRRTGKRLNPG